MYHASSNSRFMNRVLFLGHLAAALVLEQDGLDCHVDVLPAALVHVAEPPLGDQTFHVDGGFRIHTSGARFHFLDLFHMRVL